MLRNKRGQEGGGPNYAIVGMLILVVVLVVMVVWEPKAFASVKKVTDKIVSLAPKFKIGEEKLGEGAIPKAYRTLVSAYQNPPGYLCIKDVGKLEGNFWIELKQDGSQLKIQLWTGATSLPLKEEIVDNLLCSGSEALIENYKDYLGGKSPKLFLSGHFAAGRTAIKINPDFPIKLFSYEDGDLCILTDIDADCVESLDTAKRCDGVAYPKCEIVPFLTEEELILPGSHFLGGIFPPLIKNYYGSGWHSNKLDILNNLDRTPISSDVLIIDNLNYRKVSTGWQEVTNTCEGFVGGFRKAFAKRGCYEPTGKIISSKELSEVLIDKLPRLPIDLSKIKQAILGIKDEFRDYVGQADILEVQSTANVAKLVFGIGIANGRTYDEIIKTYSAQKGTDHALIKAIITHEMSTPRFINCVNEGHNPNNIGSCIKTVLQAPGLISYGLTQLQPETITGEKIEQKLGCNTKADVECQIKASIEIYLLKKQDAENRIRNGGGTARFNCNRFIHPEKGYIPEFYSPVDESYTSSAIGAIRGYNGWGCGGDPDHNYVRHVLRYYTYFAEIEQTPITTT